MAKKQPIEEKKQPVKGKKKAVKKQPGILDTFEQTMFAGVGLISKTRDEVTKLAKDFAKQAEMSEKEGKKLVNDFLKRYDKSRGRLEEKVEKTVRDVISRSGLVTKDELNEIKAEIKKLNEATTKK